MRPRELRPPPAPIQVIAEGLTWRHAGGAVFEGLDCTIGPGLTLIRGGDGRGKTSLLRLLAGTLQPAAGRIHGLPASLFFEQPADAAHDAVVARDWLGGVARRHPAWSATRARASVDAFALQAHVDKPLFMLSSGSRRKVGLVAAAASGAHLTLLDTPYAALDAASRRVLDEWLRESATSADRAWVVADHAVPAGLADVHWAGLIDLDDLDLLRGRHGGC